MFHVARDPHDAPRHAREPPSVIRLPTAVWPGHNRDASVSLTSATFRPGRARPRP